LISREKMLSLYAAMVRCRRIAERGNRSASGITAFQEATGWEAAIAGVTAELIPGDCLRAQRSSILDVILCELQAEDASAEIKHSRGTEEKRPSLKPEPTSPHALDEFDEAFLAASAFKVARCGKVAVVFSEELQMESWRRRLQQVARRNLPLLIVSRCSAQVVLAASNGLSKRIDAPKALAYGVPVIAVDANDALAIYRVASESVARARQRRGPTLIECLALTPADSAAAWQDGTQADPIVVMEAYLLRKGFLNPTTREGMESRLSSTFASQAGTHAQ
jgi:TPP-dependent pyruvate/acetoin dehydrogenase alpha subunit